MDLFKLTSKDEPVEFYARDPKHIIDLVSYYYQQTKEAGELKNPKIAKWVTNIPTLGDIERVEKGYIKYQAGMINFNSEEVDMKGKFFSEKMQVTPDFEIAANLESLLYFDIQRHELSGLKRVELYKFMTSGIFGKLYFIPEDIMKGIVSYDLSPHLENAEKRTASMKKVL